MTDEQTWAIVNAPGTIGHTELARSLGVTYGAVIHRRRTPWVCNVRYATCVHCDEPITLKDREGRNGPPQHYECRIEAKRVRRLKRLRERPPEKKARSQAISYQAMAPVLEEAKRNATRSRTRWTSEEDNLLLATMGRPVGEVALKLNRSYHAVAMRRTILKKGDDE